MSGWQTVRLGDVLAPVRAPISIEDDHEYAQITVRIKGRGLALRRRARGSDIATKRQFRAGAGQLLVSKIDARNGGLGLVPPELDGGIVSGDFPVFDVDAAVCMPEYLELVVSRPEFWDECLGVSEGSTNRVRLVPEQFLDLEIDLPTLGEQEDIVSASSRIASGERAWTTEGSALRALFRSLREREMETDGDWDDMPPGWTRTYLGEVAEIRSGITKGRKTAGELTDLPFIRAANVQDGFLDLSEIKTLPVASSEVARFSLAAGDVLMTEGGNAEHLGRGWLWEAQLPHAVFQNHVFRARPRSEVIAARFLAYAIGASPAREYCLESAKRTTNLASINKTQISELPLPLPPLAVQRAVVARLDAVRQSMIWADRNAARLRHLRAAFVEEVVSGARPVPRLKSVA